MESRLNRLPYLAPNSCCPALQISFIFCHLERKTKATVLCHYWKMVGQVSRKIASIHKRIKIVPFIAKRQKGIAKE